ncbi:Transposase IS200 like protein [Pelotomaculum sp. FP]|nr:Transposase IS200 like protein [Pelotomaculum sp. FP]
MLVSIPPKLSVSNFMGYLKGKSSLMIFDRHANLKYKYGNRQFWCKGFYEPNVLGKLQNSPEQGQKYNKI